MIPARATIKLPAKPMKQCILMTFEPIQAVASKTVNLMLIGEFTWAVDDNFSGFEAAVEKQVSETLLPLVGEQTFDDLPEFSTLIVIVHERLIDLFSLR